MTIQLIKCAALIVATVVVAGCATAPQGPPPPASLVFPNAQASNLASRFTALCGTGGARIISSSAYMVECARPMGDSFKETMYKALAVEQRGASNPDFHLQWSFVDVPGGAQVSAHTWIEHQNAFGKNERDDVGPGEAGRVMEGALAAWKEHHAGNGDTGRVSGPSAPANAPLETKVAMLDLMRAQQVAKDQNCSNTRTSGQGFRASCGQYDLLIDCDATKCRPVRTVQSEAVTQ
ncbi:hypothetical protein [Dyella jiangningensis]|uniref:hypothetical protein n=1 Tax=Dyella jiangningensis TaxID=1379159 RepID=UPI0011BDA8BD|nr:hypothetical protein [Dyella jiangningensis]